VAFLGFHPAMTPFHPFTSLIYFGSSLAFLLGTALPRLAAGPSFRGVPDLVRYNWRLHWILSFLLFAVFLSGMAVAYSRVGVFPALAERKQEAINAFNQASFYSNITYNMGAIAAAMFLVAILQTPGRRLFMRAGLWLALLSTAIFSLSMNRSGALLVIFFGLTVIHYGVRRISLLRVVGFFVLLLALFIPVSYSRLTDEQKTVLERLDPLLVTGYLLKVPYVYMANNYWNLDYALNPENYEVRHPTTYGYTTFSGILDVFPLPAEGLVGPEIRESGHYEDMFHERSVKIKGINTLTYQWGLYKDFGLVGVLTIPFFIGLLLSVYHRRMREQPDVSNIAVYAYFSFFIAFNWFTAMWELTNFVLGFLYLTAACYLCRKLAPASAAAPRPMGA
jgi:oligosaccharide repeat unit polymerase